jgi:two-component system, LytTR family, response regulator LytT
MKYAIIENEQYALENLQHIVSTLRPDYEMVFSAESIEDSVMFFRGNQDVALIFMDIELVDGDCFEIFRQVDIQIPVIFTTAYNEYAIQAFKVNSVDYLLKPVTEDDVNNALLKFEKTRTASDYTMLTNTMTAHSMRKRILTSAGDSYSYIEIDDIAFFISEDKYVFAYLKSGKRCITEFPSLGDLVHDLDPDSFFQLSRGIVAGIGSIHAVKKYFNGRLKVVVKAGKEEQTAMVSAARRKQFLVWLGGDMQ